MELMPLKFGFLMNWEIIFLKEFLFFLLRKNSENNATQINKFFLGGMAHIFF